MLQLLAEVEHLLNELNILCVAQRHKDCFCFRMEEALPHAVLQLLLGFKLGYFDLVKLSGVECIVLLKVHILIVGVDDAVLALDTLPRLSDQLLVFLCDIAAGVEVGP